MKLPLAQPGGSSITRPCWLLQWGGVDENAVLNVLFAAVVESVEETVLNSLRCAETMTGRDGNTAYALPLSRIVGR